MKRLLALALLSGCAGPAPQSSPSRPNIVLILADDLGYSDLGCYGGEILTPNLDRLASRGLKLTQFYNTARCCPTRASLLTGLYPQQVGVGHLVGKGTYPGDLSREHPTVAELLKKAGYATYMSGKWHLTPWPDPTPENLPRRRGFDRFYGIIASIRSYYSPPSLMRDDDPLPPPQGDYHFTDAVNDEAVRYIDEHRNPAQPFFLYVAEAAPHWPMHAREADVERCLGRYRAGWDRIRASRAFRMAHLGTIPSMDLSPRDPRAAAWDEVADKEWFARRMAVYAAMVEQMDRGIGRILEALERKGVAKNTLVLFLSDNGGCAEEMPAEGRGGNLLAKTRDGRPIRRGNRPEVLPGPEDTFASYGLEWANASNTPFRLFKSFVHEGGISTPLIAWGPGIPSAELSRQVGHVIDLLPTCLEAAGVPAPPVEGRSLLSVLHGGTPIPREPLFWEHEGNRAVRAGRWKLAAELGKPWQLYDLEADRTEGKDLAERNPERVAELSALYERWAERCGVKPWTEPQTPIGGRR